MTRILIIEDNANSLSLMTYLLDKFGYSAPTATDGEEGLSSAKLEKPDLIICDLHMPNVDGWEFAQRIKRDPELRSVPLIAVTAVAMVGDRERVLSAGFDGYITKPIDPETFIASIEAFIPHTAPPQKRSISKRVEKLSAASEAPATMGTTVLVVDDVAANRDLLYYILQNAGYTVSIAGDVTAGLKSARADVPDMIITDVHMEQLGGFDLIEAARSDSLLKRVPVILTSASGHLSSTQAKATTVGAAGFLSHPIIAEDLLAAVANCLNPERASKSAA